MRALKEGGGVGIGCDLKGGMVGIVLPSAFFILPSGSFIFIPARDNFYPYLWSVALKNSLFSMPLKPPCYARKSIKKQDTQNTRHASECRLMFFI